MPPTVLDERETRVDDRQQVGPTLHGPGRRSERVKLRRALTLLGMTVLLPGSAQLAAGHRGVGRLAVRVWLGLWSLTVLGALFGLLWRSGAMAVLTFPPTLRVVQALLIMIGVGWGLLLLDAWRLARPPELARRHRPGFALLSLLLVIAVVGGLLSSASMVSAQRDFMSAVFAGGGDHVAQAGRYNILLMGGDAGKSRVGLRPDSLTVASVDAETGRTVLISLPRNLEDVPFPAGSPLRQKFPRGFGCADNSCMLNAVYTYATNNPDLYPGVDNPGAQATKEAVEGATGLKINYWALIDLRGFRTLVDAVGGITVDVNRRVPIGGGGSRIYGYIEKGQDQHLDGSQALWFARSRADSSDYDRMARQKCVMNAMLKQLDPVTVLTNFNQIAAAGQEIVATDIPASQLNAMLELATKAKDKPMSSLALVPPMVYPGSPDFARIHDAVAAKVAAAEAADQPPSAAPPSAAPPSAAPASAPPSEAPPSARTSAPPSAQARSGAKPETAQDTDDLGAVCSA